MAQEDVGAVETGGPSHRIILFPVHEEGSLVDCALVLVRLRLGLLLLSRRPLNISIGIGVVV